MDGQRALFAEMEPTPAEAEPRGFRYQDEILTEEEEAALAAELGTLDLQPFEFHGHVGNRRVASFGLAYNFSRRSVERAEDMPGFLEDLLVRAARFAGVAPEAFRQVGVNEYRTGAGIGWHKDKAEFGNVVGVSLLAAAPMRFRRAKGDGWERISHALKPRSIYMLSGEARREWEHSVPPVSSLRYSINFRTLGADT
ncbi:MAG TPA: alpha-ketoglutarate-dependent dioxygenase AlkB [Acidobacteriaceae bacterium]|jgi:alkylated DNA repair dioxygenase AlkB|nr:alpha-ketoglutarate-dependent dioxygenase AlkB [Acidobacteriaceae bacterium]